MSGFLKNMFLAAIAVATLSSMAASQVKVVEFDLHPNPKFPTRQAARLAVANYILFHNTRRRHSSLDYVAPIDYEEARSINN